MGGGALKGSWNIKKLCCFCSTNFAAFCQDNMTLNFSLSQLLEVPQDPQYIWTYFAMQFLYSWSQILNNWVMPIRLQAIIQGNQEFWQFLMHHICIQLTLQIVSTLYSEQLHIVNNFGDTLQWRFRGIVSIYSEPLYIVNKILLQVVFTIWRVDCIHFFRYSLFWVIWKHLQIWTICNNFSGFSIT